MFPETNVYLMYSFFFKIISVHFFSSTEKNTRIRLNYLLFK